MQIRCKHTRIHLANHTACTSIKQPGKCMQTSMISRFICKHVGDHGYIQCCIVSTKLCARISNCSLGCALYLDLRAHSTHCIGWLQGPTSTSLMWPSLACKRRQLLAFLKLHYSGSFVTAPTCGLRSKRCMRTF